MKIHREFDQSSLEWGMFRAGKVTASEAGNLITPHFKRRKGDMVESYLAAKVAENWLGGPLPGFGGIDMDLGKILEQEAIPHLRFEHDMPVESVGFISRDDERSGCSPDGVVLTRIEEVDYGVEIKCPGPKNHCRYLLEGVVPEEYRPQVAFSMFVTNADRWFFVSYHRRFPTLIVETKRDAAVMSEIYFAVEEFIGRLDRAINDLETMNGGPRERQTAPASETQLQDLDDVMP